MTVRLTPAVVRYAGHVVQIDVDTSYSVEDGQVVVDDEQIWVTVDGRDVPLADIRGWDPLLQILLWIDEGMPDSRLPLQRPRHGTWRWIGLGEPPVRAIETAHLQIT